MCFVGIARDIFSIFFFFFFSQISESPKARTAESASEKRVICYYTNWAWKRASFGKFLPENIDGELCTHVVYAFATLNVDWASETEARKLTLNINDSIDVYRSFLDKATELGKRNNVKVLLGVGGWNDSKGDKYSRVAASPSARKTFAQYAVRFVTEHGFNGLHLDWQFPVCPQVNRETLCYLSLSVIIKTNSKQRNINNILDCLREREIAF